MTRFLDPIGRDAAFVKLLAALRDGTSPISMNGLLSESLYQLGVWLRTERARPVFLLCPDEWTAKNACANAQAFLPDFAEHYPAREIHFFNVDALQDKNEEQRVRVMTRLSAGEPLLVCTTLMALAEKITTPEGFLRDAVTIRSDGIMDPERLRSGLRYLRYEPVSMVESRGQFSVRGGIVDIFPANETDPVRLEFFDTEIDSLRTFDVSTQRSIEPIDAVTVGPAVDMLIDDRDVASIAKGITADLKRYAERFHYGVDIERATEKFTELRERVEQKLPVANIQLLVPYLQESGYASLLDYLPADAVILADDLSRLYDGFLQMHDRFLEDVTYQLEKGEVFSRHEDVLFPIANIMDKVKDKLLINATQLMKRVRLIHPKLLVDVKSLEAENFGGVMQNFLDRCRELVRSGTTVLLALGSQERVELLRGVLYEHDLPAEIAEPNLPLPAGIALTSLSLSSGVQYPDARFWIITHKEIYGRAKLAAGKVPRKKPKATLKAQDLEPGDYVVHENHGIGRFVGFEQMTVDTHTNDYLLIQYHGNDRLYLPTDQMHLIQKYIGKPNAQAGPRMNRLNSAEWRRTKARAKKAVAQIAEDLIRLYAQRAKLRGHAFAPDTTWQREFEDSFIYEETLSQLRSIEEIKKDMESDRPMDRLLCGDVGYGKTEVALRAAFKAIMDGRQVAMLVPTTILAQQHYQTARERFRDFPVRVDVTSRFRTAAEQKDVLEGARRGYVDLLIGTHRLLTKDLRFKDLGLLIVDEEQRFGVRHKEKLKQMRENVDVLTMSATPIPRTLRMGLTGIRDMSILDDPPEERFPTTTYVLEYDAGVVGGAIRRELDRGGQVYFVYNRVTDIERMAAHIAAMVPEARIGVGHGQMSERQLEQVMQAFIDGETDILLCTTIIETGLDIHNVNTMIVYDADRMGLAQMYQLKGRIGRSNRTSYAYFTYEKDKVLQETAEKRLLAIRDFSEFGSGFKIAMRDLELRGAGNLLGETQSGHIEAIGYDLYVRYLEEAVKMARGEDVQERPEVDLDIRMDGYIPLDYIPDNDQKMEAYKEIASVETEEDFTRVVDLLIDRFGDIPPSVYNIIVAARLKSLASEIGFTSIGERNGEMVFALDRVDRFTMRQIAAISAKYPGQAVFNLSEEPSIRFEWKKEKLQEAKAFLAFVADECKRKEGNE